MSRHNPDLVLCMKQPGIHIGRLCDKCDGKCPICDSYVRPANVIRICDECAFGNFAGKCIICGGQGISDAFYCYECTRLEKIADGCPNRLLIWAVVELTCSTKGRKIGRQCDRGEKDSSFEIINITQSRIYREERPW